MIDYDDPYFLNLLHQAQGGEVVARQEVVLATLPIIWNLTRDPDEVHDLIIILYEQVLPRWTTEWRWGGHAKRVLTWRYLNLLRHKKLRISRGF